MCFKIKLNLSIYIKKFRFYSRHFELNNYIILKSSLRIKSGTVNLYAEFDCNIFLQFFSYEFVIVKTHADR